MRVIQTSEGCNINWKLPEGKHNKWLIMPSCLINKNCFGRLDPHHLKTRGSGGDDSQTNVMPLCRLHHTELHKIGLSSFVEKYGLQNEMRNRGFFNALGQWRLAKPIK